MPLILLLLALSACSLSAPPPGYWTVRGHDPAPVLAYVEAAKRVTGDVEGALADGGLIEFFPDLGPHITGLNFNGSIQVLYDPSRGFGPALKTTALAHELAHLGYGSGDEGRADAGALLIEKELLP